MFSEQEIVVLGFYMSIMVDASSLCTSNFVSYLV